MYKSRSSCQCWRKSNKANVRTATVLIHLLWWELLASPFHHLHPVMYLLYRSYYEGQLVVEVVMTSHTQTTAPMHCTVCL